MPTPDFSVYWAEAFSETAARQPSFEYDEYYRSGRASKEWPDKETPAWWAVNGPKFVKSWRQWRKHSGLDIVEVFGYNGEDVSSPAIELQCWAENGDLLVQSILDRVMHKDGEIYIVDIKTGSFTPPWPLQLIINNLCLWETYGIRANYGGFWKARKGGIEPRWFDLSIYPDEWVWEQVAKAKEIRDRQLFIANPNNLCTSACGVRQHCIAMGGTPFFPLDATMTQDKKGTE